MSGPGGPIDPGPMAAGLLSAAQAGLRNSWDALIAAATDRATTDPADVHTMERLDQRLRAAAIAYANAVAKGHAIARVSRGAPGGRRK